MSTPIGSTARQRSAEANGAPGELPARPLSDRGRTFLRLVDDAADRARDGVLQLAIGYKLTVATADGLNEVAKAHGYKPASPDLEPERTLRWLEQQLGELAKLRNEAGPF